MPTTDVRFGVFDETEKLELYQHWRTLLEGRQSFYDLCKEYDDYWNEIDASDDAMDVVNDLGYTPR